MGFIPLEVSYGLFLTFILCTMKKSKFVLPIIAEVVLSDAKRSYEENQKFTTETLQTLNSVFGEILMKAMDVLDTHKFVKYTINSGIRCVHKVHHSNRQYMLFNNINYCTCDVFTEEILTENPAFLTCQHILGRFLADIVGLVKVEMVTESQLTDLLNNHTCTVLKCD